MTPPIRQNPSPDYSPTNLARLAWNGFTKMPLAVAKGIPVRVQAARVAAGRSWDYFQGKGAPADFSNPAPPEVQAKLKTPGGVVRGVLEEYGNFNVPWFKSSAPISVGGSQFSFTYKGKTITLSRPKEFYWHTVSSLPTQLSLIFGMIGLTALIGAYELTAKTQNFVDFLGTTADFITRGLTKDMPVDSDYANTAALVALVGIGLYRFGGEFRGWMVKDPTDPNPKPLSVQRTVLWTALLFSIGLSMRALAETTGLYGLTPDGDFNIFAHWVEKISGDYVTVCTNLVAGRWSSFITGAFISGLGLTVAGSIPQVLYTGLGVATRSYNIEMGNDPNKSLIKYVADETRDVDEVKDPVTGEITTPAIKPLAAHDRVIDGVQKFSPTELEDANAGKLPEGLMSQVWRAGFFVLGAYLAKEGLEAGDLMINSTTKDATLDTATAVLGLSVGASLLVNSIKPGSVPIAAQLLSTWSHLFNATRIPFALVFIAVHGTISGLMDNLGSFLEGQKNVNSYYAKMFFRGYYAPTLNRVILNFRQAIGQKRISRFSYFLPGFIFTLGLIKAQAEAPQAAMQLYEEAAIAYANADRPETRAEHLDELQYYRTLVDECLKNNGYGRDDALDVATETLAFMNKTDAKLKIVDFNVSTPVHP